MNQTLVLVVDDEEKNQKLLCALLSHEGLEVAAAPSGEAALASVEMRLPDLTVLDAGILDSTLDIYRIWVASNGEVPGATFCFEIPL